MSLRLGVLFSERTDLAASLIELAEITPDVTVAAAATDRRHPAGTIPRRVPLRDFPIGRYPDRVQRDLAIAEWLGAQEADLVVAAGWLWLLTPEFLDRFPNRVVNVHPTLLPAFPGRHSVEAAVAHGVHVHGVTVHLVDTGIDTGPILAQAASQFPPPASAAAIRIALAPVERELLGQVVEAFAQDRVRYAPGTSRWTIAR